MEQDAFQPPLERYNMAHVFNKKEKTQKPYYFIAERKYDRIVRSYQDYGSTSTPQSEIAAAIKKELDEAKAHEPGNLGEDYFYYNKPSDEVPEAVELPFGSYKYQKENYPIPERLEPYSIRSAETYITLPELEVLKKDLNAFLSSKELYNELGFPYRRGYLLHGRPGNGKTALIRSLLSDGTFASAHVIWMSSIPSDEMVEALNQVDSLKVVVFEEIVNQNDQVNFDLSSLLAFMDGECSLKNCITVATTNYPEHLGENLANRPSRFDVVLKFDDPSDQAVYQVLEHLLKRPVTSSEFVNKEFSFAQIKEIVLLHSMFKISLNDAAKMLEKQSKQFERGFEKEKEFGFGLGGDND